LRRGDALLVVRDGEVAGSTTFIMDRSRGDTILLEGAGRTAQDLSNIIRVLIPQSIKLL